MAFGQLKSIRDHSSTPTHIIIKRSAMDESEDNPWVLISAVADYVNMLWEHGLQDRHMIPPKALQVIHTDFYLESMENGGHAQFIYNCAEDFNLISQDVNHGLSAMKAYDHAELFHQMMHWCAATPQIATGETEFLNSTVPFLQELDEQFFHIEEHSPLMMMCVNWILSWPDLTIMNDEAYSYAIKKQIVDILEKQKDNNTLRIKKIDERLSDKLYISLGMAATEYQNTEILTAVGKGVYEYLEDGSMETVWAIRTTYGPRFGIVSGGWSALYEHVEGERVEMPKLKDMESVMAAIADGKLARFEKPKRGKRLSIIKNNEIVAATHMAQRYFAAAALDLLLSRADIYSDDIALSIINISSERKTPIILEMAVLAEKQRFQYFQTRKEAQLRLTGSQNQVSVTMAEIMEHAREFAS